MNKNAVLSISTDFEKLFFASIKNNISVFSIEVLYKNVCLILFIGFTMTYLFKFKELLKNCNPYNQQI